MSEEASVRMTVDSSQAMLEQQKYLRAATETFNVLQSKSQSYSSTLQQRIKFLEKEIELQKESIRLNRESTTSRIQDQFSEGKITSRQKSQQLGQLKRETSEDTRELQELNKVFKQWANDQRVAQQKAERFGDSISRSIPQVLGSSDASGMIGGMSKGALGAAGILGILGAVAGIVIGKELKGAAAMEPAMRDYAVLSGQSLLGTRGAVKATKGMDLGRMGLTTSQYFTDYSQLFRSGGGVVNESMLGILAGEKALGLSRQQTGGLMGLERYGEGKVTPIMSFFERYLRETSQNIAILPEILQTFSQEATAMLKVTGRVDSASIAASVAAISKGFGLTGEPLQNVVGAFRQGMQQSSNPVIQSLQFSAMERARPGSSLWQMEMAMENPLSSPKYMTNFLNQLQQSTGGGEMYARSIYNVFGQYGISRNVADDLSKGKITPEMFIEEAGKYGKGGGYRARAEGVTGELESLTATWQGMWERTGFNNVEPLVAGIRKIMDMELELGNASYEILKETRDVGLKLLEEAKITNSFKTRRIGSELATHGMIPAI